LPSSFFNVLVGGDKIDGDAGSGTPAEVQEALQYRNQIHFDQAHGTFPTTQQFTDHVDWMASTKTAELLILNGKDDIPDIARELLATIITQ
jgi:hypothetical protein